MFNMLRRVASLAPTRSPGFNSFTSFRISIVPLEILVGMLRAWKKEVFSGPSPVFCGGTFTTSGARAPALAGAATLLSMMICEISLGEHKADVAFNVWQKFLQGWVVFHVTTDSFTHHGVFTHQQLSMATQGDPDLLHLLGPDIVHSDHKAAWVLIKKGNEFNKVVGLPRRFVFLDHLCVSGIARCRFKDKNYPKWRSPC